MRTCRRLGIPTVALYSETGDGLTSLHAQMADEAYPIGIGPSPVESYLRASEVRFFLVFIRFFCKKDTTSHVSPHLTSIMITSKRMIGSGYCC